MFSSSVSSKKDANNLALSGQSQSLSEWDNEIIWSAVRRFSFKHQMTTKRNRNSDQAVELFFFFVVVVFWRLHI